MMCKYYYNKALPSVYRGRGGAANDTILGKGQGTMDMVFTKILIRRKKTIEKNKKRVHIILDKLY